MEFLNAEGNVIATYPKDLPPNYLNFRFGAEEWLKKNKDKLRYATRWRVTTSWVHQYLSDGNKRDLEPMILSHLPPQIEKQVDLQRPDISGWDMDEHEWRCFILLGINERVFKPGDIY